MRAILHMRGEQVCDFLAFAGGIAVLARTRFERGYCRRWRIFSSMRIDFDRGNNLPRIEVYFPEG